MLHLQTQTEVTYFDFMTLIQNYKHDSESFLTWWDLSARAFESLRSYICNTKYSLLWLKNADASQVFLSLEPSLQLADSNSRWHCRQQLCWHGWPTALPQSAVASWHQACRLPSPARLSDARAEWRRAAPSGGPSVFERHMPAAALFRIRSRLCQHNDNPMKTINGFRAARKIGDFAW